MSLIFDKYAYNTRSEVIDAQRYYGTDVSNTSTVYGGREFDYAYDPIGNRISATETIGGETLAKSYAANELNQYTAIANPDAVGLRGVATNSATVTVNGNAALRDSVVSPWTPWHHALEVDNANGGVFTFAEIMAVINPPGTNTPDLVSTASGNVYAPPQAEVLAYDDDGNLLSDGRWQYTWNGENRLIKAEELVCPTNRTVRKIDYAYDHQGRMVWKTVSHRDAEAQSWEEEKATSYLWDAFNIIAEMVAQDNATNTTYSIWGLDSKGPMQGVGGVGGLLAVVKDSVIYIPAYDANGNIMEYSSDGGAIVAHREYDPYGGTVVATGDMDAFTHWFSTKPWCPVTWLSEYQYRKYNPMTGRWMSRDPIEEAGSISLYLFVNNSATIRYDILGLQSDEVVVDVETLTDMLVLALFGATEYHLDEEGRVYKKLVAEMEELVHNDIMRQLKGEDCCSIGEDVHGLLTDLHQYGGKLFTVSLLASIVTLSPVPVLLDPDWGPMTYNFYTIGNMVNNISYSGSVGKSPALGGILCCYSYSVTINSKVKDTFDFVPDKANDGIKNIIYNTAATIWKSIYNDVLGATRPDIKTEVTTYLERSGCY